MKKILLWATIAAQFVLIYLAAAALYGSDKLPARIPVHFGIDGKPDGWGGSQALWMLPIIAMIIVLLMTMVARYPKTFNYPVPLTRENQARLEELALSMIAWLKFEMLCLFTWIEWGMIQSARLARLGLPVELLPIAIAIIFGTIAIHIVGIFKAR